MHVYYAGDIGRTRAIITSTAVFKKSENWRPLQNVHELMIEDEDGDFREIPEEFENLRHLQTMNIQWTRLKGLSPGLGSLPLTHAMLANNRIQSLSGIESLTKLLFLDVSFNNLTSLPDTIDHLRLLRQFRASGNKLKELPDQIGNIISLVEIVVSSNQLKTLPDTLSQLHLLKCLDFSMNAVTVLPARMDGMKNLRQLVGSCNKLTVFPHTLQYCTKLRHVFVRQNCLREVPDFLRTLQLESFNAQQNQITDIKCPSATLGSLLVDGNQLSAIPQTVIGCNTLTNLSMAGNQLTEVPVNIRFMKQLRHLNLGQNQLQVLPVEICDLRELRHLIVPGNKLQTLPLEIAYMMKLVVLSIENNEGMDTLWESTYRRGGMNAVRELARQRLAASGGTLPRPNSPALQTTNETLMRQNMVSSNGSLARPTSPMNHNEANATTSSYETLNRNQEVRFARTVADLYVSCQRLSLHSMGPKLHWKLTYFMTFKNVKWHRHWTTPFRKII